MKIRNGFVSNSSSSSFIVKYTNKSGHDMSMSDIIQQNRDVIIEYLDHYGEYDISDYTTTEINKELEDAIKSDIVIPNNSDIFLYIESGEDGNRLSIVDFKDKCNCKRVNENLTAYYIDQ